MLLQDLSMTDPIRKITKLLDRAQQGDRDAARDVLPLVYAQLRELAKARMRAMGSGQTIQATALVHAAYVRIADRQQEGWDGKRHFFFAAARAMRDILIEHARKKKALKRGGDRARVEIEELGLTIDAPDDDLLALDAALEGLAQSDPEGHRIVTLRYYGGLSMDEIAKDLGVSTRTVDRRWRFLRTWLADEIRR